MFKNIGHRAQDAVALYQLSYRTILPSNFLIFTWPSFILPQAIYYSMLGIQCKHWKIVACSVLKPRTSKHTCNTLPTELPSHPMIPLTLFTLFLIQFHTFPPFLLFHVEHPMQQVKTVVDQLIPSISSPSGLLYQPSYTEPPNDLTNTFWPYTWPN